MKRQTLLLIVILTLILGNIAYRVWAGWGLITVDATDAPLPGVIYTIEKQAGVDIRTNLGAEKKVTMHVKRVPLAYALDVLANVSDARWELGYFLAPSKAPIESALTTITSGEKPEGWKRYFIPLPGGALTGLGDEAPVDPRHDLWEVKPASEQTLQAYLDQAAKNVSVRIEAPLDWNPAVSTPPKSGQVKDVLPRLAKAAGGEIEQVFLLTGARPRGEGGDGPPPGEGPDGPRRSTSITPGAAPDPAEMEKRQNDMEERVRAEIAKLSGDARIKAQAEFDERKKFWDSVKDLPPEQRRSKFEERMQDPAQQEKMFNGMGRRDAMKTPQQRNDRYRDYVSRKQSAQN